ERGLKLGEALVELGILGPEALLAELGAQARHKLERSLRWRDGDWRFTNQPAIGGARGDPVDLVAAVLDGVRATLGLDPLPSHLALAAGRPFTLRPRGVRMLAAMTDRYPRFVAGCHDGATIEALEAAGVDRAEALTALDALTLSDGVELAAGH